MLLNQLLSNNTKTKKERKNALWELILESMGSEPEVSPQIFWIGVNTN